MTDQTSSAPVDPTEFSETPLGVPSRKEASTIPPQILPLVIYGNGAQASPIGIATFPLECQGFHTKLTCPILGLGEDFDAVLGHKWCLDKRIIISYKDEQVTFVYKKKYKLLWFNDSYCAPAKQCGTAHRGDEEPKRGEVVPKIKLQNCPHSVYRYRKEYNTLGSTHCSHR